MVKINTVLGKLSTEDLGMTLMHEHLGTVDANVWKAFPDWLNRSEFIDYAVGQYKKVKDRGIDTIVDVTPLDLGRDIHMIKAVSEKSGVNVVACTGIYGNSYGWHLYKDPDYIASLFIREAVIGIEGTDIKAGVIKCATHEDHINQDDERMLKIIAKVHKETGLPIITHSIGHSGYEQQDVFEAEGVDLSRVVIGHLGDLDDVEYIVKVAERGSYLGLDRFSIDTIQPLKVRAQVLKELCDRGYRDQIIVSHDCMCFMDGRDSLNIFGGTWDDFYKENHEDMEYQYTYVFDYIWPELKRLGMTQADFDQFLIRTPRTFFER
ncbi:phosphotriesterase [Faecalicatena contorta]|uniref:phosphotriesterase family protein n=1 Tax=Faecalicatena contorta TaxID=39482 RepID=UPI00129E6D63|nr:phosphotriesterase [Faecalicatena contorta]MRM87288.1 phosphotriesterase [Faecalicatena contorta]